MFPPLRLVCLLVNRSISRENTKATKLTYAQSDWGAIEEPVNDDIVIDIWINFILQVLTAAHCLKNQTSSRMRVKVGALNLDEAANAYEQTIGVSSFVIHADYMHDGAKGYPNDIGIIYLASPVVINANVQVGADRLYRACEIFHWFCCLIIGESNEAVLMQEKLNSQVHILVSEKGLSRYTINSFLNMCSIQHDRHFLISLHYIG